MDFSIILPSSSVYCHPQLLIGKALPTFPLSFPVNEYAPLWRSFYPAPNYGAFSFPGF